MEAAWLLAKALMVLISLEGWSSQSLNTGGISISGVCLSEGVAKAFDGFRISFDRYRKSLKADLAPKAKTAAKLPPFSAKAKALIYVVYQCV